MSILAVKNLNVSYGDLTIVDDVSFTLEENHWLMLVGPNGAGKSTVVNAISQGVPYTGDVIYDGRDVCRYKPSELAKRVGVLAQSHSVTYSFTVGEVVRLGRYSHSAGILRSPSDDDDERIHAALEVTGMLELENQSVLTLSGGELQRVFLAQIFAQDPKVLVLDEPTNHLDLVYQKQVFELVKHWNQEDGRAVISVVHDLSLARAYGTDIILMNKGSVVSAGDVDTVLSRENLKQVYSMDVYEWMTDMLSQWKD